MELQELRDRIRRWKARQMGLELPEDDDRPAAAPEEADDMDVESVGPDDYAEEVEATPEHAMDRSFQASDPSSPPADEVMEAPSGSEMPYEQGQAYDEPARAAEQPAQLQLTPEQIAAVQQYGQQLAQQGYAPEQIHAAQTQYVQQILAHMAAQLGGQGRTR